MKLARVQTGFCPYTTSPLLGLRTLGGTIKRNKLKASLVIVVVSILAIGLSAAYFSRASQWPAAIDMSSTMHMPGMDMSSLATPMDSLVLGQTDAPLVSYTLTAEVTTRAGLLGHNSDCTP